MSSMSLGTVLLSAEDIQRRVAELGRQISTDYAGRTVTAIGILKGSFLFVADLVRHIHPHVPVEIDFMAVSSYGNSTSSSGAVCVDRDAEIEIADRDVLIIEDIVDTGLTLLHVHNMLSHRGPRTIRVAALLEKPGPRQFRGGLDYVGFQIPNRFVVGYGLDYAQRYRNLPDIRILDEV